jgi:serine/threonine protein phosphatase PrpC
MTEFQFRAAGLTDTGLKRTGNEDSMLVRSEVKLWIVADGMGGHHAGEWASAKIARTLAGVQLNNDFDDNFSRIDAAVHEANDAIVAESKRAGAMMGSTVAILHCCGSKFAILWAGDSRVYLRRNGELYRMTSDHSEVQEMVDAGLITDDDAARHPRRSVLTRAVGTSARLQLDAIIDDLEEGDTFLLCSDGLTGHLSDADIDEMMDARQPGEMAERLVRCALDRGGKDNVTVIAVACEQKT